MIDILHADAAVVDACRKAKQACTTWAQTAPQQRADTLSRAANLVEANASDLAELNTRETHKLLADSQNGVSAGIATLRQFAELGPLHQGQRLRGEVRSIDFSIPQPHGVVAVLTPWNDPVAIACGLLGAALVSGNTVVYKPSERCPAVGKQLGDLLAEVFPPGVFTTVTGPGSTGAEIIVQGEIDMVAHVGSTASGARIARAGALTGAHTILENGGNDPLIIDDDVDVGWAAQQAALGCFANAGQICTSVERIFVHQRIAKEFTHALCGEASRWETEGKFGPLVDQMQRNEVHHQVVESLSRGARLVLGGKIPAGDQPVESFYPATVVTNVESGMPLFDKETFGPVAAIACVPSFDEALAAAANDSYGLGATVLTNSLDHASQAAAELPVATVKINNVFGGAPGGSAQPQGWSGKGFGYGPKLLDEMTWMKVVHQSSGVAGKEQS